MLSGISFKANKIYANIIKTNACDKYICLIINWRELEEQDTAKIWILMFFRA